MVHHAFDDEHEAPPCHSLAIAKGCHVEPASLVAVAAAWTVYGLISLALDLWTPNFSPAPFSQRAPPIAS